MSSAVATPAAGGSRHVLLSALPDERLAKLAAQGSAPAFAAIYRRHHQDLYRYCQSLIGNEHDARDALQETMVKAMRALDGEQRELALRPWLFRIAHNESMSLMRRRRASAPLGAAEDLPARAEDQDVARERVRELFADLAHLTPRQRSALVMRELNGLGFEEIGAAMSISAAAAKQTVYEARQALLEVAKGREADCGEVRRRISARDRRLLRGRGVSAHLRTCADCRDFEAAIATRGQHLAAVAPLPAVASAGILQEVVGATGGSIGGGGIAIAAAGGSLTAVAKIGVAGIVALGVGALAVEGHDSHPRGAAPEPAGAAMPALERSASPAGPGAVAATARDAGGPAGHSPAGPGHPSAAGAAHGGTGASSASPADAAVGGGSHAPGTGEAAQPPASPAPGAQSGSSNGGGSAASSAGSGTPVTSGTSGGGSAGSASSDDVIPPGQGGTPPGQGGTPPGLGGEVPPGLGGTPPGLDGGLPPGQGGTPPGLDGQLPPGQGGTPPGQSGTAPGHN